MAENKSGGKAAGKLFFFLSLILAIAALLFSMYLGGQQKTVNSYYTAIIRDDYSEFEKLFAEGIYSDALKAELSSEYAAFAADFGLSENGIMHIRPDFICREMHSVTEADYTFTVTYYDDELHSYETQKLSFAMKRSGTKWVLCSARPEAV
ncbi:MAG: hypothetical protein IJ446_04985 [Oscillospiraceae bacterium]|nr:hypothetical protein [Oscillospiraceae bacterium]